MTSLADLLAGADGVKSAFNKESTIGEVVTGQILEAEVRQVTDYDSGAPKFWDDGNPQQQVRIVVQTTERDPMKPDDDGRRAIFVKWWGDQRQALMAAIKASGDTDIRVGGNFSAVYAGDKPSDNPRRNPAKLYEYAYQPPATGLDFGTAQAAPAPSAPQQAAPAAASPFGAQQTAPQQAAPVQAATSPFAAQQAAVAPATPQQAAAPGQVDVEKIKQLLGLGLADADIATAVGADITVVAAIRNLP